MRLLLLVIISCLSYACRMDEPKGISNLSIVKIPGRDTIFNREIYSAYFVVNGIPPEDSFSKLRFRWNDKLALVSGDTGYVEFIASTRFNNDTLFEALYKITAELKTQNGLDTTLVSEFKYYLNGLSKATSDTSD